MNAYTGKMERINQMLRGRNNKGQICQRFSNSTWTCVPMVSLDLLVNNHSWKFNKTSLKSIKTISYTKLSYFVTIILWSSS